LAADFAAAWAALAAAPGHAAELLAFEQRVARAGVTTAEQRTMAEKEPREWITLELEM